MSDRLASAMAGAVMFAVLAFVLAPGISAALGFVLHASR